MTDNNESTNRAPDVLTENTLPRKRAKSRRLLRVAVVVSIVAAVPIVSALVAPLIDPPQSVDFAKVAAVAKRYPDFTMEQHRAVMAEIRSEQRPAWKTLSVSARIERIATFALRLIRRQLISSASGTVVNAPFVGNSTFINNSNGNLIALQRQSNCSLSLFYGTYSVVASSMTATVQVTQTTPNFEQTLHSEAQLTTTVDAFPHGCVDPKSGFGTRRGVYLGTTAQGEPFGAGTVFSAAQNTNGLVYGAVNLASTAAQSPFTTDYSVNVGEVTSGDLNGDGLADVVGIGPAGSIDVWIANSNGTLSTPVAYAVPGDTTEAAVVTDVNGDGKLDVVVATLDSSTNQEMISVLTGKGDGTLNAAQSMAITTPGVSGTYFIQDLAAADLRSNGSNDIIASNGVVLLNNGNGTFTQSTPAYTPTAGQIGFGGYLAAADFNNDGKPDLAADNGDTISIYLGNGDGTFTQGNAYVSDTETGYLTATDLDGDGNVDLYVGTANSGAFGGDQDDGGQSYAVMGNGDGTFQGAPVVPFVYTGTNLAPLTSGGVLDAVAAGANSTTFTSYLGDGKGNFTAKTALTPPATERLSTFAIGDVTGDGKADLVAVGLNLGTQPESTGIYVAAGDGQGDFATPTYTQIAIDTANHYDTPGLSNLQLIDVNHDGKLDAVYQYTDVDFASGTIYVGFAVQLGNGDGTFQAPKTLVLYSGTSANTSTYTLLTSADVNGDGYPDLFFVTSTPVANQNPQISYSLALGNGDGTFQAPTPIVTNDVNSPEAGGMYGTTLAVADMNGDGIPDLVTIGQSTEGYLQIAIALGNGNGTFKAANKTNFSMYGGAESVVAADFNGDGKVDVAILGPFGSSDSGVVFGNGDGTLAPIAVSGTGNVFNQVVGLTLSAGLAVVADFNGDGKPDILSGTTILLNQYTSGATSTSTPSFGLTASSAAGTIAAGQSATSTLTLTPSGGFDASVSLSCSGLPSGATCAFSPVTPTVSGNAVTDTLTITTTAATANVLAPRTKDGLMFAGILLPFVMLRRGRSSFTQPSKSPWARCMVLLCALILGSCGGGGGGSNSSSSGNSGSGGGGSPGTVAGTYTVTITATGGSVTQTLAYTLTVS